MISHFQLSFIVDQYQPSLPNNQPLSVMIERLDYQEDAKK